MTSLDSERLAALFYVLMRDHEWPVEELEQVVRQHVHKVQGQALFSDPDIGNDARRLARLFEAQG